MNHYIPSFLSLFSLLDYKLLKNGGLIKINFSSGNEGVVIYRKYSLNKPILKKAKRIGFGIEETFKVLTEVVKSQESQYIRSNVNMLEALCLPPLCFQCTFTLLGRPF